MTWRALMVENALNDVACNIWQALPRGASPGVAHYLAGAYIRRLLSST